MAGFFDLSEPTGVCTGQRKLSCCSLYNFLGWAWLIWWLFLWNLAFLQSLLLRIF